MANYEEARYKLANIQLSKLKSATKNKTGTTIGGLNTLSFLKNTQKLQNRL